MAWQQLTLRLDADELPRIEALLRLAGSLAVAVSDDGDEPVLEPAPGTTPMWPRVCLRALFPADSDVGKVADLIAGTLTATAELRIDPLTDENWIDAWRQTIVPLELGSRLTVVPAEDLEGRPVAGQLALHRGVAFGTGQHATTRLCLQWLTGNIRGGESVLDFGCGSGILALAALRLGAAEAFATDDDPQALTATAANARLNGLGESVWLGPPEQLPCRDVDIVLANILAGPLIVLAPIFAGLQRTHGRIVLSGVLPQQAAAVEAAYAPAYEALEITELEGWCRLTGERR